MDTVVNDFVQVLRDHRLRVSPAESIDALNALRNTGIGERETVKDTLRATLVKNGEDTATFDRLFDLFFSMRPVAEKPGARVRGHDHDHDHGPPPARLELGEEAGGQKPDDAGHTHDKDESTEMRRFFDEERMRPSNDVHGDAERMRLSMFSQELILNRKPGAMESALQRLTYHMRLRRSRNMFNPGGLVPNPGGEEIPLDVSAVDLEELIGHLHELEVDEAIVEQLESQAENILKGLPDLIKQMQERDKLLKKDAGDDSEVRRALRKMLRFSASEQREMEAAVRRIARRIQGARTRRLKEDRIGRISVPHTLRHNVRYEGVPFDPVLRRKREGKPRVALLCDVSLSTRNLSRFWLHMIYQMQSLFSKVRTFVFVADVAEVTQVLEEHDMNRAVDEIFSGRIIDADVNSDFGKAAGQFRDQFLPTINHRTTVVILGDGRNNGKWANPQALEEISQHARQVVWITPEPRWGWNLGSCDMPLYEPICDRVEVVRTVEQLGGVAEGLVKARA